MPWFRGHGENKTPVPKWVCIKKQTLFVYYIVWCISRHCYITERITQYSNISIVLKTKFNPKYFCEQIIQVIFKKYRLYTILYKFKWRKRSFKSIRNEFYTWDNLKIFWKIRLKLVQWGSCPVFIRYEIKQNSTVKFPNFGYLANILRVNLVFFPVNINSAKSYCFHDLQNLVVYHPKFGTLTVDHQYLH